MEPSPCGAVRRGPTFLNPPPTHPLSPSPAPSPPPPLRPIVLALGSRTLRYGTSDDFSPYSKAFAIAYRIHTPHPQPTPPSPSSPSASDWLARARSSFERLHPDVSRRRVKPPPKPKFFDDSDAAPLYEEGGATTTTHLSTDDTPWTDTSSLPSYITGDAALSIHPDAPYALFFPLQMGHLNVQPSATPSPSSIPPFTAPNTSYTAALSAVETILYDTLTSDLHLPLSSLPYLSVVLSLPSTFIAREVFDLASVLLDRLRVRELSVHCESVLAAYGSGLASACVVDVGAQVTRVVCVDEGLVVGGSEVSAAYGSEDVGELLFEWMKVHDHHMPCPHIQPRLSWWHWLQVQRLKERVLNATTRDFPYQWVELRDLDPHAGVRVYRMNISSAAVLAPRALFEPALFRGWGGGEGRRMWSCAAVLDVCMDDVVRGSVFYAFTKEYERRGKDKPRREVWEQVRRQQAEGMEGVGPAPQGVGGGKEGGAGAGAVAGAAGEAVEEKKEEAVEKAPDGRRRGKRRKEEAPLLPPPPTSRSSSPPPTSSSPSSPSSPPPSLTHLVAASLNAVPSLTTRRRLALSILLTGAFCAVPHLVDYVGERLAGELPGLLGGTLTGGRGVGEEVQCVLGQKLVEVGCEGWKGGAVIAGIRVEGLGTGGKDKWITREEWQRNPNRCMRERLPFVV